jgi:hypothetical protein
MLRISELPDPNDRVAIVRFSASFNGYKFFGSFEACAENAKTQRRASLVDLRNELFFSYRASNHRGDDGVVATYHELLPHFHRLLGHRNKL